MNTSFPCNQNRANVLCYNALSLSLSLSLFFWMGKLHGSLSFFLLSKCLPCNSRVQDQWLLLVFFFFFFLKFYKGRTNGPNIKLKKKKSFLPILYLYYWFFFFFYLFCKIPFWNIYFRINEQNVGYIFCLLFYFKEVFFLKKIILKKLMRTINK